MTNQITPRQKRMIEAMRDQLGVVTAAVKQAGISRKVHYLWLNDFPEYKLAIEEMKELCLDFAENALFKQIKEGNVSSTQFYLKSKGKSRGYVEKQEIEMSIPYKDDPETIKVIHELPKEIREKLMRLSWQRLSES